PPVANVESILVLLTVHLDELAALSRGSGRAEQKPCEAVPAVFKRRSACLESDRGFESRRVQGRYARIESERAAWALAQLRLPVVHKVVEKVEAKPDLMSALHPARVRIERVGLVIAEKGVPFFGIAEACIVGDIKSRHAPFPRIRPVSPGKPQ